VKRQIVKGLAPNLRHLCLDLGPACARPRDRVPASDLETPERDALMIDVAVV
jgi:hypothetical protein